MTAFIVRKKSVTVPSDALMCNILYVLLLSISVELLQPERLFVSSGECSNILRI
jgi:hypothetical protein